MVGAVVVEPTTNSLKDLKRRPQLQSMPITETVFEV